MYFHVILRHYTRYTTDIRSAYLVNAVDLLITMHCTTVILAITRLFRSKIFTVAAGGRVRSCACRHEMADLCMASENVRLDFNLPTNHAS